MLRWGCNHRSRTTSLLSPQEPAMGSHPKGTPSNPRGRQSAKLLTGKAIATSRQLARHETGAGNSNLGWDIQNGIVQNTAHMT